MNRRALRLEISNESILVVSEVILLEDLTKSRYVAVLHESSLLINDIVKELNLREGDRAIQHKSRLVGGTTEIEIRLELSVEILDVFRAVWVRFLSR